MWPYLRSLWLLAIGWALGVLTIVIPNAWENASKTSGGREEMRKCQQTYPIVIGWNPEFKYQAQYFHDHTGSYYIYRDQAEYEAARKSTRTTPDLNKEIKSDK